MNNLVKKIPQNFLEGLRKQPSIFYSEGKSKF
jgi:hypothetical protein